MRLAAIASVALLLAGCSRPIVGVGAASQANPSPLVTPNGDAPFTVTSSYKGATVTVTLSSTRVAAGGEVTFTIELRNDRSVPLVYGSGGCDMMGSVTMKVPLPLEPAGRTWTGAESWFKDFAMTNGLAGGGVPATQPLSEPATGPQCDDYSGFEKTLDPGGAVKSKLSWTADIIPGLDALAGPVEFDGGVGVDRLNSAPSYAPDYTGIRGSWFPMYHAVEISGQVEVTDATQHPVSMGEAIDGLLGDANFTTWLEAQPAGTCQGVNVLPTSGGGIFKPGPNWEIDLFCETGVPRHWAIAGVDPFTAEVRSLTFCNVPCDR